MSLLPAPDFGALLRRHRRVAGLTQEELAERAGVSVNAIGAMERGLTRAPHKDTIALLAEALQLSQEEHAELEAAARGRLASVPPATRDPSLHLVRAGEDQAEPEQPAATKPLTPASFATQAERPSPLESIPPTQPALLPAKRKSKRVVLGMVALLLPLVVASSGLGYWFRLGPFGKGAPPGPTLAPDYLYVPPTHTGGTITFSETGGVLSANPWFVIDNFNTALWGAPYTITPNGSYLPDELVEIPTLANGGVSKDGLTVTMHLRPDLRWSDGQPLTADDFKYWLEVELDPGTGASNCCFGYDQLASYQAQGAHMLVLRYKRLFAPYLSYLPWAAPRHTWGSIPHQDLGKYLDPDQGIYLHPEVALYPTVTSGPFMIASHTADQRITMERNTYYRSTTLHGSVLDQLIYTTYPFDVDALIAAFQAGQTDFTDSGLLFNERPRVSGIPGYKLSRSLAYAHLDFNLSNPYLQDVTVRRAVEEAIARCTMIQTLYQQPCENMRVDTMLPAPSPAYDPSIKTYGYDLAAAEQDMLIAGWDCSSSPCTRNRKPFPTLKLVTFKARFHQTALVIQQNLADLGIPVELDDNYTFAEVFDTYTNGGILARGQYDLSVYASASGLDPDSDLYPNFHSSQIPSASNSTGLNYERVYDPNIDSSLEQGRVTLERAEHMRL